MDIVLINSAAMLNSPVLHFHKKKKKQLGYDDKGMVGGGETTRVEKRQSNLVGNN